MSKGWLEKRTREKTRATMDKKIKALQEHLEGKDKGAEVNVNSK